MKRSAQMYLSLIFLFILGNHNGFIALWQGQSPLPARIFPYSVSALPKADQNALEKGIIVRTEEELNRILEDYLS